MIKKTCLFAFSLMGATSLFANVRLPRLFSDNMVIQRDQSVAIPYYEHIGVYAFRKQTLMNFTRWPVTPLEAAEKIECLRYLEHGIPLKMVLTEYMGIEIDTPEDLKLAIQKLG